MASVHDVAAYILEKSGPMTTWKLQKLVYYSQAWSLVWDDEPLFPNRIEAWANGPVVPALYRRHRGQFQVTGWDGEPDDLRRHQRETIDAVLDFYGQRSSQWLSDLTHRELPWVHARKGLAATDRGNSEITKEAMVEYYSTLASGVNG